ncbi:MAG TPA: pitrilysin family protein [Phycisphaerae bacterium]|nr:pitrilysin family protein [Phycisphaerae bacterium]
MSLTVPLVAAMACLTAPLPPPTSAPAIMPEAQRIMDQPDEIVTELANGMVVILKRHAVAPVVAVRMYVKAGSMYEQEYLGCGMSHLFEHLLHGGSTRTRSETDARRLLDRIGSQSNAYTTNDHTCYYIETASRYLPEAVNLLADFITRPAFDPVEFDREWGVVQRELEMHENDPVRQLYYLLYQNIYQVHPARYPVIGFKACVQTLTREDIIGYYRRMYVPDNVVFAVSGDIVPSEALRVVQKEFADFTRRPVRSVVLPDEPAQATARKLIKYMDVPDCRVSLAWPTIRLTHKDLYGLDVLSDVLSRGRLSRLVRRIVIEEQLATTLDSYSYTPHWGPGLFDIEFTCEPAQLDAVIEAIEQELANVKTELVSEDELQRVKRLTIANHVYSRQKAAAVAGSLARGYMSTGDPHFDDAYVANIQGVTAEQVRQMAGKYLLDHRRNTTMVLPETTRPPQLSAASQLQDSDTRLIVLDNGLRVLIRPDPSVDLVAMQIYLNGGLLYESRADNGISNLLASAARYGTTTRSFEQIAELTESRGIEMGSGSGRNTFYFTSQCLADDLDEALPLLADMVARPAFPERYVEMLKRQVAAAIRRIDDEWSSHLVDFFHQVFFSGPYAMRPLGSVKAVESLAPDTLKEFHARRARGDQAVLAVFGKLDPDRVAALVQQHFGDLPGGAAGPPAAQEAGPVGAPALFVTDSKHTETAGVMVGYRGMRLTDVDDYYPMLVVDTIVGGYQYPGGWLHSALRGTDPHTGQVRDLVYAVHFVNRAWVEPGYVAAIAGCQPAKVGEVLKIILGKMDLARQGQFTMAEFELAKDLVIAADALDKQTNADLAAQACLDELYGLGYDFRRGHVERIQAVTLEQVKRVAAKYLTDPIICITTPDTEVADLPFEVRRWTPPDEPSPDHQE